MLSCIWRACWQLYQTGLKIVGPPGRRHSIVYIPGVCPPVDGDLGSMFYTSLLPAGEIWSADSITPELPRGGLLTVSILFQMAISIPPFSQFTISPPRKSSSLSLGLTIGIEKWRLCLVGCVVSFAKLLSQWTLLVGCHQHISIVHCSFSGNYGYFLLKNSIFHWLPKWFIIQFQIQHTWKTPCFSYNSRHIWIYKFLWVVIIWTDVIIAYFTIIRVYYRIKTGLNLRR